MQLLHSRLKIDQLIISNVLVQLRPILLSLVMGLFEYEKMLNIFRPCVLQIFYWLPWLHRK